MTSTDRDLHPARWLAELLQNARDGHWCTYHACTTCAANKFREAYAAALFCETGVPYEAHARSHRRIRITELCNDLDQHQRSLVIDTLVRGLRGLPEKMTHGTAFRWVILDLDALVGQGNSALYDALEGSHAYTGLHRMVEHSKRLDGRY